MIVLDYLVHSHIFKAYILAPKSVKLLRLELYGNDIYTSIQAIIRRYRTIVSLLMIVLDKTFLFNSLRDFQRGVLCAENFT